MTIDLRIFETHLRRYAVLYFMLGLIERELRSRCVITLSMLASEKGYSQWFYVVPATRENIHGLRKALKKNRFQLDGVEGHLTFAFWRHLFDGKNFTTLWLPALFSVFPSVEAPQTNKSFSQVGNHLTRANKIRNRVAHYEIHTDSDYQGEKAVLLWIIQKMGGVSA